MVPRLLCLLAFVLTACTGDPAPSGGATPSAPASSPATAPAATPGDAPCPEPCRGAPREIGRFRLAAAPEASGLAASRRNPGLLYVLDDGPGTTSLLAISAEDGSIAGRVRIADFASVDSEALAVARCSPDAAPTCIYVGDIGDNVGGRDHVTVLRVREPRITRDRRRVRARADVVRLRYPDRAHDAEALLVSDAGTLVIVTKAASHHGRGAGRVYYSHTFADTVLTRGARVRLPPPAVPLASAMLGNVVTGGDSVDGSVVLRTYDALYELRGAPGAPLQRFPSWEVAQLPAPNESQGEAVAYGTDGCRLFTVSEGSGVLTALPCR